MIGILTWKVSPNYLKKKYSTLNEIIYFYHHPIISFTPKKFHIKITPFIFCVLFLKLPILFLIP